MQRTWCVRYHLFSLLLAVAPINVLAGATKDCYMYVCAVVVVRLHGCVTPGIPARFAYGAGSRASP